MTRTHTLSVLVVASFAIACAEPPLQPSAIRSVDHRTSSAKTTDDTYLVRFHGSGVPADFSSRVQALGGEVTFAHAGAGIAIIAGVGSSGAAFLGTSRGVAGVDADAYTVQNETLGKLPSRANATESPANPTLAAFIGWQWNMMAVSAPSAWTAGKKGNASVRVGILDTGIDYLHPDLVGRVDLAISRSFLSAEENARVPAGAHEIADLNYHGTHVAATVASNAYLAAGIASDVTLVGLKVCTPGTVENGFRGECQVGSTLAAVLYATDLGLDVINLSLGGSFNRRNASGAGGVGPSFLATINRVYNYARTKGTTVVVSAGNDTLDMDHDGNSYNAYCTTAATICVSSTGPTGALLVERFPGDQIGQLVDIQNIDALAGYSNFGRSSVEVAAPGGNVLSVLAACSGFTLHPALGVCRNRFFNSPTSWSGSVVGLSGTSMSAPHVTGLAALIAADGARGPAQIQARLQQSADDLGEAGTDPAYGKGRINVARALGLN